MNVSLLLIEKLNELKEHDTISSYSHIKNILKNQIIPIVPYEYKPSKLIRYRRHTKGEIYFESSEQLSYRKDILNIKDFGRANEPGQGLFYCNDYENQNTGIAEAVSVFRNNKESKEEILTVGIWKLKQPLKLAVVLPTKGNYGKNLFFDKIKSIYDSFEESQEFDELKNLLEFISNEFTLDLIKNKTNYKISCAYSNYIKESFPGIDGLIYSSVKSELEGTNIVIWPEVVGEKLEFVAAGKSIFRRIFNKTFQEIKTVANKYYDKEKDKIIWE